MLAKFKYSIGVVVHDFKIFYFKLIRCAKRSSRLSNLILDVHFNRPGVTVFPTDRFRHRSRPVPSRNSITTARVSVRCSDGDFLVSAIVRMSLRPNSQSKNEERANYQECELPPYPPRPPGPGTPFLPASPP